ncbi:MAG TPA: hypothetical protein PLP57_03965 [Candidatus Saccharicenans sp.]|jgi:hypothetical protein|nr:hypothetical protein [Candidatus Saccharicenans sp.]HRD01783.1 hypothetical protein [Candidatus Saccharicenans sp.]
MKLRTKMAIFLLAVVISLAGFAFIANSFTLDHTLLTARPVVETSYSIFQIVG